jgi:hypothetical protein
VSIPLLCLEDRKKPEKSKSKNVGYHFRPQRGVGPRGWRLRTLCKRNRIVSHIG